MSSDNAASETVSAATAIRSGLRRAGWVTLLCGLVVLIATQPAAAQTQNPVCQDSADRLATMIEGFLQITVALGLMGLLVVWQFESLMQMLGPGPERQQRYKDHQRVAGKSAVVLVVLGPLFAVAGTTMGLPIAECVDLIPF